MKLNLFLFAAAAGLLSSGCGSKPPPDPNDPKAVGILQPEVLQRNLAWASEMVNERVAKSEITQEEAKAYLVKYASELTSNIDFKRIEPAQAWRYAEVFRTAQSWENAKKALEVAVEHAKKVDNQDRRVNDSLRLAEAYAHLGDYKKSIEVARSVFDTRERDKGPILMSVLYEIVPTLRGHDLDAEAAKLLEDAIDQHMQVVIDENSEEGKAFLVAKWHHIGKAWNLVVELYREAGQDEFAQKALERGTQMMDMQGRL